MNARSWWERRWVWILAVALLATAYLLGGVLLVPAATERMITSYAENALQLEASVGTLRFNPLTFKLEIRDASFRDGPNAVLSFDALAVQFYPLVSLYNRALSLGTITLEAPSARLHRDREGRLNWARIVARSTTPGAGSDTAPASLPSLYVQRFTVRDGTITFSETRPSGLYRRTVHDLDYEIRNFSTRPADTASFDLRALLPPQGELHWSGKLGVVPLHAGGELTVRTLPLVPLDRYLRPGRPVTLDRGRLSASARLEVRAAPHLSLRVRDGRISLDRLELQSSRQEGGDTDPGPLLRAEHLTLDRLAVRWDRGEPPSLQAAEVLLRAPRVHLVRTESGDLNWTQPFATSNSGGTSPERTDSPAETTISARVGVVRVEGGAVRWIDRAWSPTARALLRDLTLRVDSLRWPAADSWPVVASVRSRDGGRLRARGSWRAAEQRLTSRLRVTGLPLSLGNPYWQGVMRTRWDTGTLRFRGRVEADLDDGTGRFEGSLGVDGAEMVDRDQTRITGWKRLETRDLRVRWPGPSVELGEVRWNRPYLRLFLREGYRTNLGQLLVRSETAPAKSEPRRTPPDSSWSYSAGPLILRGASLDFADANVPGGFRARIHDLGGTVGALSSRDPTATDLHLQGRANRRASLGVDGRVNPFGRGWNADVNMTFRGLTMTSFSPYAIKFAGHRIERGRLDLDLRYRVDDTHVEGENHLVLDRFQLGEKVPSPSALSLPFELAVALLKDDQGIIDLNIPISGDLANPRVDLPRLVANAVRNTITSIVSSPFRLLAEIVGGEAEQLQSTGFDPGRDRLDRSARASLEMVAEALGKRPRLELQITPVWADSDRRVLARRRLNERISDAGGDTTALERSRELLERLYVESFSRRSLRELAPADTGTQRGPPPVEALHRRLVEATPVSEGFLRELARRRGQAIRRRLEDLGIDPGRLRLAPPQQRESGEAGRVHCPLSIQG